MRVQKTRRYRARTLEFGELRVVEPIHVCATECQMDSGKIVTQRSEVVSGRLLPRRTIGYDLMTWVGLQRFMEHP